MNTHLCLLLISVISSLSLSAQTSDLNRALYTDECREWVDSVFNTLNDNDKIAQLIITNVAPDQGANSKATLNSLIDKHHIGGVYFSKGTSEQFAEMTNFAQSLSKIPLIVGIDGEWGPAMRVTDAPVFPRNMGLGAIQDPTILYRYGAETARQCKALGIQIDFAPVLDVNSNPNNPVIGNRSYGEDPMRVAQLGRAYSLGLESEGVMAVAKHFPGHGDTNTDSHKSLPTITHDIATLERVDLLPFKAFIEAGCGGVMVGHLSVPALDASKTPASMSNKITSGLLKDKMGFSGLVITDGLGMKGAAVNENLCVAALMAGADILLQPTNVPNDILAVKKAITDGKISQQTIDERCKKVLAYKYALGLNKPQPKVDAKVKTTLNDAQSEAVMQELADAMITVLRNEDNILPLGDLGTNKIAIVNIGAGNNDFTSLCKKYADVDTYTAKDGALSAKTLAEIKSHDVVVVAIYNDGETSRNTLATLKGCHNLVPVFFINPYKVSKFRESISNAKAIVMAYENNDALCRAAAMGIFGGIKVDGKLPVNVNGVGKVGEGVDLPKSRLGYSTPEAKGMDPRLTTRLDSAVNAAIRNGAFPGAQLIVARGGDIIVDRCYGVTTRGGEKVTANTLYDLASVSKTVGTLPGVMKAYDMGLFELDQPAFKYVEELEVEDKCEITPRMLLHHESGMPASLNMYKVMMDSDTYTGKIVSNKRDKDHTIAINGGGFGHNTAKMRRDIVATNKSQTFPIEAAKGIYTGISTYDTIMANIYRAKVKPERKYVYSCLNFCLLMEMEQRLTGQPHQQWVTDSVWAPIGAYNFCYRPSEQYPLSRIAATENDTYLRKQHVQGYVHDELAAFSGGVQGNAGVFGTATDVAKLCQMWLNGGTYGDKRIISPETAYLFTTEKSKTCRRGLGFDKPDINNKQKSPTCDEAPSTTYGHTGFTGTCFWVDPDNDLIYVFLCNRVDPTRKNKAFSESLIRPTLMSLVYQSF